MKVPNLFRTNKAFWWKWASIQKKIRKQNKKIKHVKQFLGDPEKKQNKKISEFDGSENFSGEGESRMDWKSK